jgi:hypothetical protein
MSYSLLVECSVKNRCMIWAVLSGVLWHLHPICYLTYQRKGRHGQIKDGRLKTEKQWYCVLKHTLWSLLLGCLLWRSHFKGKFTARNANRSWDPSVGLWVIVPRKLEFEIGCMFLVLVQLRLICVLAWRNSCRVYDQSADLAHLGTRGFKSL